MLHAVLLPLFISCNHALPVATMPIMSTANNRLILLAKGHRRGEGGTDHGDDPHDEQHDGDLPANAHKWDGHPSGDPYAGTTPNNKNSPFTPY